MKVSLVRNENGTFDPVPQAILRADLEQDYTETMSHGNEPLTGGTFLDAALEGVRKQVKGEQ